MQGSRNTPRRQNEALNKQALKLINDDSFSTCLSLANGHGCLKLRSENPMQTIHIKPAHMRPPMLEVAPRTLEMAVSRGRETAD
jgi:hypothetical protein